MKKLLLLTITLVFTDRAMSSYYKPKLGEDKFYKSVVVILQFMTQPLECIIP